MTLRVIPVLALVFTAAVLFPLRRAQRAFPSRSTTASLSGAPRPKLRRRPGATVLARRAQETRAEQASNVTYPRGAKQQMSRASNVSNAHEQAGDGDRLVDVVDANARPARHRPIRATTACAVVAQTVGEVPAPPPKHA